ncbi:MULTISPECIES: AI-2E family transporter [Pseudomonas]|uniref:AI-2E family transporter n=2 Tax=Gammaproteobacteria TaxID=1236 RepID=A0A0J6H5Q1_9PSED|nr:MULTISPECIES: AI-2E family transporter [Pseudomonas]KAB0500988.1 AI-2E family transporter [Pseudomonas lini]KMM89619.1 membrane protein [Pseudomonas lini]KNH45167.1 membrane protein [Pseudomonas lini]MDT9674358.1 AI-2E family transporter [Pseudomonas sp. JV414]NSX12243.1 AI-2E family transporter [Pseudomonas lini]
MNETKLQNTSLMVLLTLVSIAFIWILLPFYGAVFWAVILGILFAPLQHQLQLRFGWPRDLTALCTLILCVLIAILPVITISTLLVQEGASLYSRIESGELDIAGYVSQFKQSLPPYVQNLLDRFGMGELAGLREKIIKSTMQGSQFVATKAFSFGQGTFEFVVGFFVMLYLLFFFLRDGSELARKVRAAIPLEDNQKRRLQLKFNRVVRATVKGNVVVAITQGALGGFIFWYLGIPSVLLWAVLMAFLSLLPLVGAGIVWIPVAAYFLLSGAIWQGTVLVLFGIFVIGLVDNVLRPMLVGKDTKMPDYLILISTLGGLAIFGLNGFVIGPLIAALFVSSWAIFVDAKPRVQLP